MDPQRLVVVERSGDLRYFHVQHLEANPRTQDVLSGVFAYMQTTFDLATRGERQSIPGTYVSGDYFSTLGVPAIQEGLCYLATMNVARRRFA